MQTTYGIVIGVTGPVDRDHLTAPELMPDECSSDYYEGEYPCLGCRHQNTCRELADLSQQ
jgi:hypothetical protein